MLLTPPAAGEAAAAAHGGDGAETPHRRVWGGVPPSMGLGKGCDSPTNAGWEEGVPIK